MKKAKELVSLRQRKMRNGGYSLFLDYSIDGVRYKEYLKMYLVEEKSRLDKIQNEETYKTALGLKARRTLDLQDRKAGFVPRYEKDCTIQEYIMRRAEVYSKTGHSDHAKTLEKIALCLKKAHIRVSLQAFSKDHGVKFVEYLQERGLSESTVYVYFSNLNSVFNSAYREGLIVANPLHRMDVTLKPKRPESTREYLTVEELRLLQATPCSDETTRNAFFFSCFTGLRLCDVENLRWTNIKPTSGGGWQVEERQKKTKKIVVIPLSENALGLLPPRGAEDAFVWKDLRSRSVMGKHLQRWVERAGITKRITFHCARHTNATLLFTYGVDIYTVMSLLGHTDVATTQIYAKIVNEKKVAAVNMIPKL